MRILYSRLLKINRILLAALFLKAGEKKMVSHIILSGVHTDKSRLISNRKSDGILLIISD